MQSPVSSHVGLLRAGALCALTLLAAAILGYHPFAEDGGIYFTALLQLLHPELFPHAHDFAWAHLHHSAYLALLSAFTTLVPLSVEWLLFFIHIGSIAATLGAVYAISSALRDTQRGSILTVAVVAIALSLPVAGTALYIADPYVTARAFSTPMLLGAYALVLRRRMAAAGLLAVATIALHPLMGLWGTLLLIAVGCAEARRSRRALFLFCAIVFLSCGLIRLFSPSETGLALTLARSRAYWYLARWEWFEWIGLVAPPVLLWWLDLRHPDREMTSTRALATGVVVIFALAATVSLLLVHPSSPHVLLARMQPLRMLQFAYLGFFVLLGEQLTEWANRRWRILIVWTALSMASLALFVAQRATYPASAHIEFPSRALRNPWSQAFIWIRSNTAPDAIIALDAHYITAPGADAQNARAITQRSTLPDYSKDGGVASVETSLAEFWQRGERAQEGLEEADDAQRLQRLSPFGATWIVLRSQSATGFDCPYKNGGVKVCRLRN